jgi:shikimate kinase
MKRSVVLLGLPGAGKTTAGKLAAQELGAPFVDTDAVIVRRLQKPVARIFAEDGEPRFRTIEAEVVREAIGGPAAVIVPGAGWAAQPGVLDEVLDQALFIYMKVLATTAGTRAGEAGGRPLLSGQDPVVRMRELLRDREPFYARAQVELKADRGTPELIAKEIAKVARERAGWDA